MRMQNIHIIKHTHRHTHTNTHTHIKTHTIQYTHISKKKYYFLSILYYFSYPTVSYALYYSQFNYLSHFLFHWQTPSPPLVVKLFFSVPQSIKAGFQILSWRHFLPIPIERETFRDRKGKRKI